MMEYNNQEFWAKYKAYQEETQEKHVLAWECCRKLLPSSFDAFDLGCGPTGFGHALYERERVGGIYSGIDRYNIPKEASGPFYTIGDYEDDRVLGSAYEALDAAEDADARTVVGMSLFSTECVLRGIDRMYLYDHLFDEYVSHMVVAGFYYENRMDMNPVEEAGGLTSWQTNLPARHYHDGDNYTETFRVVQSVPSEMFGPDVYEVWRVLEEK